MACIGNPHKCRSVTSCGNRTTASHSSKSGSTSGLKQTGRPPDKSPLAQSAGADEAGAASPQCASPWQEHDGTGAQDI